MNSKTTEYSELTLELSRINFKLKNDISRLLKTSVPTALRIHQLSKILKDEINEPEFKIKSKIYAYFSLPFERRTKRAFINSFGFTPSIWMQEQFTLRFDQLVITDEQKLTLTRNLRHYLLTLPSPVQRLMDFDVIGRALLHTLNPKLGPYSKIPGIKDFFYYWQRETYYQRLENTESFFQALHSAEVIEPYSPGVTITGPGENNDEDESLHPLEITQTELEWLKEVHRLISIGFPPPEFPLKKGPTAKPVRDIEKAVKLFTKAFNHGLAQHNVTRTARAKILAHCERYLRVLKAS